MTHKPTVLFLCTHNAGRSLAAKVLLDHYAEGRIDVRSAGSEPGSELNPSVVAVLTERNLDSTTEFPKPLTSDAASAADVIVTMGCGDSCPVFPGKRYLDWELADPAGLPIDEVRPIVDEIDQRVRSLVSELVGSTPTVGDEGSEPGQVTSRERESLTYRPLLRPGAEPFREWPREGRAEPDCRTSPIRLRDDPPRSR